MKGKTLQKYEVLGTECTYQDEDGADYTQYCDDGLIRGYTISAYSCDPRDGANYSGYWQEIPKWRTREGRHLLPSEMTQSHRNRVVAILHSRLLAAEGIRKAKLLCYIKAFQVSRAIED